MEIIHDRIVARLRDLLPDSPKHRLCDYGCGSADLLHLIHERQPQLQLTGIDRFQAFQIEAEPTAGIRLVDRDADEYRTLLDAEPFDLVVSTFALHHFALPMQELQQILRLVKPGGLLYFFDHSQDLSNPGGIMKAMQSLNGEIFATLRGSYHRHHYSLPEALDLFRPLPVEVVKAEEVRLDFTPELQQEITTDWIGHTRHFIQYAETKADDFWKEIWLPMFQHEEQLLTKHGLTNSLFLEIVLKKR